MVNPVRVILAAASNRLRSISESGPHPRRSDESRRSRFSILPPFPTQRSARIRGFLVRVLRNEFTSPPRSSRYCENMQTRGLRQTL